MEQKLTILVVDDSPEDREACRRYIRKGLAGVAVSVLEAESGDEALETIADNHVDCILVDYRMPDMDGLDFMEELSTSDTGKTIPLILLTGQGSESVAVEAMKRGASDYLIKDQLSGEELSRTINYAVQRAQADRERREQQHFIEILLDTIPIPIFYKDTDMRYIGSNTAFAEFVGIPKSDIIGKTAADITDVPLAELAAQQDKELLARPGRKRYEASVKSADGTVHEMIFNKAVVTKIDGSVAGIVGVLSDITEHKQVEKLLRRLSFIDELTGIANRRNFNQFLDSEWRRGVRNGTTHCIVMIDIDHFKAYNDTYGHQEGDQCLKAVAQTLAESVKRPADMVARYGGEEFVALLPDTPCEGGRTVAERMRTNVADRGIEHTSSSVCDVVTISLGVAVASPTADSAATTWIEAADSALYKAKEGGRNRVVVLNGKCAAA